MPEAITHFYFAKEAISSLDEKYLNNLNLVDGKLFLYSNLYDLPYYYRFSKLFKYHSYNIGHKLHNVKTKDFIENLIIYTKDNSFDIDNILLLYACVTHYTLDKVMHPYIISKSGIYKPEDPKTKKYRGKHGYLERCIDNLILQRYEEKTFPKYDITKRFKGAFLFNFSDYGIINFAINETYAFSKGDIYFKVSLKNYRRFLITTAKDRLKIKSLFLKLNDVSLNRNSPILTSNFIYKKYDTSLDYMNHEHTMWPHPVTGDLSTLSFDDLYQEALSQAKKYLEAVNQYLFFENTKPFNLIFDNISLDTGMKPDKNILKYEASIFK